MTQALITPAQDKATFFFSQYDYRNSKLCHNYSYDKKYGARVRTTNELDLHKPLCLWYFNGRS